jgi:hypothetical protein
MKTYWVDENNKTILEESFVYRNGYRPGCFVIIDSKRYKIVRHNVLTSGDHEIYITSRAE